MEGVAAGLHPAIVPALKELGDLKRVTATHLGGSLAARLFLNAWGRLCRGEAMEAVAYETLAASVAAGRLGALDGERLTLLGLSEDEAREVLLRGLGELSGPLDDGLVAKLQSAMTVDLPDAEEAAPAFAHALALQPRAGVTCPGRARVMLQPEESHADHCLVVAVYAGLLAPSFGADPVRAWWFGMAHHLHSAAMPDAGFTGEVLLGDHLGPVIAEARRQALEELEGSLRSEAEGVFAEIDADETPEARAFHAGDVIDRVLEIEHHLTRSAMTMDRVLNEYELVHDGPVKAFHDQVLRAVGLP
jgi:5'-deoxynucleotidase YfbR-like HD superfamily hydrolase